MPKDNSERRPTTINYCRDTTNNAHQICRTMILESSRSVLEIPRRRSEAQNTRKELSSITNMMIKFSTLSYFLQITMIVVRYCVKMITKKKHILDTLTDYSLTFAILVFINSHVLVNCTVGARQRDATETAEYCKNFTQGNPSHMEFASPLYGHGHEYPTEITCFRTITADHGYFVRIDFRDRFNVEPPSNEGNCDYDYLEIRDGDQGYSPLIGKYLCCT